MEVKILEEHGYNSAKYGMSLSFKDRNIRPENWWNLSVYNGDSFGLDGEIINRVKHYDKVVKSHAGRDGGHNKFLEHVVLWLDIEASLEWWKQFDTYRVGTSKQSESTMHCLDKRYVLIEDVDLSEDELKTKTTGGDPEDDGITVESLLGQYLNYISCLPVRTKSKLLPQGYKQRREVVLSYKVLRHIILQRNGHKLGEWKYFIDEIYKQAKYQHLLPILND